jgi:hypothetical protein
MPNDCSIDRRSVLKAGASAVTMTGLSGVASAGYDVPVAFVGTETFHDNYSTKLSDIQQYCEDVWESDINDANDNYSSFFPLYTDSDVVVPESALDGASSLQDRYEAAEDWLQSNWDVYPDYSGIVVADYSGVDPDVYGLAEYDGGDCSLSKCAHVDAWHEDNGELKPAYSDEGTEGVAAHEILHLFVGKHKYAHVDSSGNATLMWGGKDIIHECNSAQDNASDVLKAYSSCNVNRVRDHIDAYGLDCSDGGGGGEIE